MENFSYLLINEAIVVKVWNTLYSFENIIEQYDFVCFGFGTRLVFMKQDVFVAWFLGALFSVRACFYESVPRNEF